MAAMEAIAAWIPSFSQLIQFYFLIITTAAFLAATLPPLRESILTYGKLDSPSSSTPRPKDSKPLPVSSESDNDRTTPKHGQIVAAVKALNVPKSWFAHFYVFATLWMIYLSVDLFVYTWPQFFPRILTSTYSYWSFLSFLHLLGVMPQRPASVSASVPELVSPTEVWIPASPILLAMACYLIQVLRRWYETWFVERPSTQARIHIGHYLVGISFYAAMAPSFWVDAYESWVIAKETQLSQQGHPYRHLHHGHSRPSQETKENPFGYEWLDWLNNWQCLVGLGLFLWGSWHQHRCHVILANLRKSPSQTKKTDDAIPQGGNGIPQEYKVPFGDWFEYFVAPHYAAEMVIYFAFYLMVSSSSSSPSLSGSGSGSQAITLLFASVWVVVNLGIVARETEQWYKGRFGEAFAGTRTTATGQRLPKRRAILIPFVY
ncbi:MAG: hypothetical protein J3Q66DRAFT_63262 [Benniella sp.]|nr:MAG: hypothetical protein J3Q66DRAFT_63262 [Benniella sp.]